MMILAGLKKEVEKVQHEIDKILLELESALVYSKLCRWTWQNKNDQHVRLPLRVAAILEKQREVRLLLRFDEVN